MRTNRGPLSAAQTRVFAAAAALTAAIVAVLAVSSPAADFDPIQATAQALVVVVPVAVGLYALHRGVADRFALILIAAGLFWAPSLLTLSHDSLPYSIGRVWAWFVEVTLVYVVLVFPTGVLIGRWARRLVLLAVAVVALLYLPTALLVDHFPQPSPWDACDPSCPANAFMVASSQPAVIHSFIEPLRDTLATLIFAGVAVILFQRILGGSRATRWTLAPLLAVACLRMVAAAVFVVARRADPGSDLIDISAMIGLLAIPAMAAALMVGLLRLRVRATRALKRLSAEMGQGLTSQRIQDLIARAIGDPSLQILYWSNDPGCWVDADGVHVELPRDSSRGVYEIWSGGHLIGALVADSTILSESAVTEVARGFSLMALENRRLEAELGSSLRELRESRARVLAAADKERLRIERDLHDGAQQRLVAMRVGIELAAEALQHDPARAASLLKRLGADMDEAVDEVRTLARGMSPPLLADHGLGEALLAVARRSTLSVRVAADGVGRYSQEVESAVYYCCLEALQNAEKHAQAHSCKVTLREDDELRFEVTDDGLGIDLESGGGRGLVNIRDRIAAVHGAITVEPLPGGGTRVSGSVPVSAARLSPEIELLLQRATDVFQDCFAIYSTIRDSAGRPVDFVVQHVNDAACRDSGVPRDAQLGRTLSQQQPGYLGEDLIPWLVTALGGNGSAATENVVYSDGMNGERAVLRAYDVRAAALGGGRLAVIWRDITQRKRADRELQNQAAILRRAAEGVCMVRVDDGMIVHVNARFAEILGYHVAELEGVRLVDLGWEEEGEHAAWLKLAQADELGHVSYEIRAHRKDGAAVWLEGNVTAVDHPEHGSVWTIVQQDVTARRDAAATLALTDGPL